MRQQQRLLRSSSAQSVCIFCACRLLGDFTPALSTARVTRRRLNTTQPPRQSAAAATASSPGNVNGHGNGGTQPIFSPAPSATGWTGFDPNSSLSRAEQAEKARLRQMREERERQEREALEVRERRRLVAEQEAQKARGTGRQRQRQRQEQEQLRAEKPLQQRETLAVGRARQHEEDTRSVQQTRQLLLERRIKDRFLKSVRIDAGHQREGAPAAQDTTRSDQGLRFRKVGAPDRSVPLRPWSANRDSQPPGLSHGADGDASGLNDTAPSLSHPSTADEPHGSTSVRSAPLLKAMPNFASSTASRPQIQVQSGWGSGSVRKAPVQYSDNTAPVVDAKTTDSAAIGLEDQQNPFLQWKAEQKQKVFNGAAAHNSSQDQPNAWTEKGVAADSGFQDELAGTIDNTAYQATLLGSDDSQAGNVPFGDFDEEHASQWQHLRRREGDPTLPREQQPSNAQLHSPNPYQDSDWIDRTFREHLQQRRQHENSQAPPYISEQIQQQKPLNGPGASRSSGRSSSRKCARCGQLGHIARECLIPNRNQCRNCGAKGHKSYECPSRPGGQPLGDQQESQSMSAGTQAEFKQPNVAQTPFSNVLASETQPKTSGTLGRVWSGDAWPPPTFKPFNTSPDWQQSQDHSASALSESDRTGRGWRQTTTPNDSLARITGRHLAGAEDSASDALDRTVRRPRFAAAEEDDVDGEERSSDYVLRSKKFAEEPVTSKRDRNGRSSQRGREDEDEGDMDEEAIAAREERRARKAARKAQKAKELATRETERQAQKARRIEQGPPVNLPEYVSVATLAQTLGVRYEHFVSRLEDLGYDDIFPGKVLNSETSGMIAMEYGFEPVFSAQEAAAEEAEERDLKPQPPITAEEDRELLPTRPPVVTIMGHVDHGKTTILDYLRKSSVAAGEAGGITQHIGAFSVPLAASGKTVTFLDTPGHAAFLAMRQRGANVTDIVILVVAADDSVKPQTLEALKHAQAANVPIIVAVNKMDKPEADLQRVKQDLSRHGVEIEDYGGETQVVPVSGKTGLGMGELEESVVTLSEILDHRADTQGPVEGWVLEATTKKAGRVATVLVRRGTLRPGAVLVAGKTWAKVKSLKNEAGMVQAQVGPGMPVEVDGWKDQPTAGDEVLQAPNEQKAADVVDYRLEKEEERRIAEDMDAINEARRLEKEKREREQAALRQQRLKARLGGPDETPIGDSVDASSTLSKTGDDQQQESGQLTLPLIIKADVSGSAEAVSAYLQSLSSPLITPRILRSQVGPLNPSDIELADAAGGHIVAFNLPSDEALKAQAEQKGVKVLENNIIYRVLDDVKAVMEERLPPLITQRVLGEAEVAQSFEISIGGRKKMKIAGCKVRNGVIARGARARVLRGGEKIYDGTISSLKNVKKDVQEMRKGTECGMGFAEWDGFLEGDQIQTYEEISEPRRL